MEATKCDFTAGVAGRTLRGQSISGDLYVIAPFLKGVLVATIDGLGHGREAALASQAAVETVLASAGQDVTSILKRCHESLRGTRGVVMSIASLDSVDNSMTWLSVGNVEGYLVRAGLGVQDKPCILMRGGVVGHSLPALRAERLSLRPGDTLVMATDGIRSGFAGVLDPLISPQQIADKVIAGFARETDDALVVVVRWFGSPG
ncbi:MAG TPA: SpoIIE family protein phosphatase [Dehalococcoidales bacterium]